jgi:hypothetical protein
MIIANNKTAIHINYKQIIPIAKRFQMRTAVLVIFSVILLATFNGITYSPYIEPIIA